MGSVEIDEKVITKGVQDAIAFKVASELSPEAFAGFVSTVLSSTDYSHKTLLENLAIDAIKKHISPLVEEWIEQNKEELKRQVFERMETEMGPAIGERIVAHITSSLYIERKR
jgi:hypothetical protein